MGTSMFKFQPIIQEGPPGLVEGSLRGTRAGGFPPSLYPLHTAAEPWVGGCWRLVQMAPAPQVLAGVSQETLGLPLQLHYHGDVCHMCGTMGSALEKYFLESLTDLTPIIFLSHFSK